MGVFADSYEQSAEYIDMMIRPWWQQFAPAVGEALRAMPPGTMLDIGAGGGQGTELIARTLPEAEVLAAEPSPGLRAVLLARAAASAELRKRVTVLETDLLASRLPDRLSGVLALNVIGHFSASERSLVLASLAERLAPSGRIVLNLQPPFAPTRIERSRMSEVHVGRRSYVGWAAAEPAGPDRITWHMTYEVYEGTARVSHVDVDYDWWVLDEQGLRSEAAAHGLTVHAHGPPDAGFFLLSPEAKDA